MCVSFCFGSALKSRRRAHAGTLRSPHFIAKNGQHIRRIVNPPKGSLYVSLGDADTDEHAVSLAERAIAAGFTNVVVWSMLGSRNYHSILVGPYFDLDTALRKRMKWGRSV